MRSPLRARLWRFLAAAGLSAALLLPAAATSVAQTENILRVGTTQDLDSLNPYATILVVGYEAFGLSYNYLVDSGPNLEPVPGFAESWERDADGHALDLQDPRRDEVVRRRAGDRGGCLLLVPARRRRACAPRSRSARAISSRR